jgi:hypothetical protein
MKLKTKPVVPLSLLLIGALAIAIAVPAPAALGLEEVPTFEFPPALYSLLIGIASTFLTAGLKDRFPEIAGALTVLISAVVTTALNFIAGGITVGIEFAFWPVFMEGIKLLISWLGTWGAYQIFFKPKTPAPPNLEVRAAR